MKKKRKKLIFIMNLILAMILCCSCSKGYLGDYSGQMNESVSDGVMNGDLIPGESYKGEAYDEGEIYDGGEYAEKETPDNSSGSEVSANRKIITKIYMRAETKEFDALTEKLLREVKSAGGYIESSSVSGNGYYNGSRNNRYATYVVRVPSEQSEGFTKFVADNSVVTNKEIDTDDVTLKYVDMESRIAALKTEQKTLENLLANAESMADVIQIQDRLTEVIYEIESYQSQLRTYDNLIDYTTITLNISEVERAAVVEEQTIWEEIATKFEENLEDIGIMAKGLFIWLLSSSPYLLIAAILIAVIARSARGLRMREQKRRENGTEDSKRQQRKLFGRRAKETTENVDEQKEK